MGTVITIAQQKGGSGKTTLATNLAVAFRRQGASVAILDTDPQGSLGRWFMARREAGLADLEFSTASAWGVSYECDKLRRSFDYVIVDTPPKVDADLRPALREADLVLVPVAASQVDVWATESVIDLARRERAETLVVLNRAKAGTNVLAEVRGALDALDAPVATAMLGHRVAFAEALGVGKGVVEKASGPWRDEVFALASEIQAELMGHAHRQAS
jgi:chromosome partitioning protein